MKRIIEITVDNYKAYIHKRSLSMSNGENVLLYGENGSGKSSLYKALRYFLSSSVGVGSFERNKYSRRVEGHVTLTYADIDTTIGMPIVGTEKQFRISTDASITTNVEQFIQLSYRVSGFLDYTQLLRAYFAGGKRPDLFDLVVDLIGDYIPIKQGMTVPFKKEKENLLKELRSAYHRSDWAHKRGEKRFDDWKKVFSDLMKELDKKLSKMMMTYFPDLNLGVKLNVPSLQLRDDRCIRDTEIEGHVYVDVKHYGQSMSDYNETLNEARLSAISICLYLASLKLRTDIIESKILYLDDVFLGLDMGNRKPVLDIVLNEFSDYQIFISTYDRSWYAQAKEILEDRGGWLFYELYEGTIEDGTGQIIVSPIVIRDDSYFDRACRYLNNNESPDYPAAANYLRKAFEELLQKHFYEPAVREEQGEMIPVFKLTQLVDACRSFVRQLPRYNYPLGKLESLLTELKSTLHPLLHPLSHYVPDVPVYKVEVVKVIRLYQQLLPEIDGADFNNHCRVFQEKGNKAQLELKGVSGWQFIYTVKLLDHLYFYYDNSGGYILSEGKCRIISIEENAPGQSTKKYCIGEKDNLAKIMCYNSLNMCYKKVIAHLASEEKKTDTIMVPIEDAFSFPDDSNVHHFLRNIVAAFKW